MEEDKNPILLEDLGMMFATENSKKKSRFGLYKCGYCGKEFKACTSSVRRKSTRSCGCLHKIVTTTYGVSGHRLYSTWGLMIDRCHNMQNKRYKDWGGRGISVCKEWFNPKTFLEWADSTYIEGYTLDRIDNDKGYSPENCRWASKSEQAINRRIKSINTSGYTGVSYHSRDEVWCANIGLNKKLKHLGYFNTIEEAVEARDNYIISNNLPHKLSTEYKKEHQ